MTDREIDELIAKALGWELVDHEMFTADPCELWLDLKTGYPVCAVSDFSPSTSVDALRKWVLPELERRELWEEFETECLHTTGGLSGVTLLYAHPRELAAAALAVLEEDNG